MKLIVFDCDGTIVDSQAGIVLSVERAFKGLGMVAPTRARVLSVVGLSLPEAFSALAPEAEYKTRLDLAERYKAAYRQLDSAASDVDILFPQAKETIAQLASRGRHLLGMATGKSRRGVNRLFDREGWHKDFATVQTADDHPSKPHPSMLLGAMQETGVAPARTVMIGDTSYDIEMAGAAGARAIGVAWGYHTVAELAAAGADAIVERFEDLPAALEDVLSASRAA